MKCNIKQCTVIGEDGNCNFIDGVSHITILNCPLHKNYIECSYCGNGNDCCYVNHETMLCSSCQSNEDFCEREERKIDELKKINTGE